MSPNTTTNHRHNGLLAILLFVLFALPQCAEAQNLSAFFNYATFYLPEQQQPYVETYLSLDAWTLHFVPNAKGSHQATVEVVLQAKQGDTVAYVKKYRLNSPEIADSTSTNFNFIDVQRFSLPNGIYDLEISLKDANINDASAYVRQKMVLYYDKKKPSMSSVQLMTGAKKTTAENILSRNGYDMEPYINDFVPEQMRQLNFYYETYNIKHEVGDNPFLVYAYIEEQTTGQRAAGIQLVKRFDAAAVVPHYASMDISMLPSGNYNLVVEAHDRDNNLLLYKKTAFIRSNPSVEASADNYLANNNFATTMTDENKLRHYLDALYPIASDREMGVIKDLNRRTGLEEKQQFLYQFWADRDRLHPDKAWREYKERVDYADANFSYPKTPGYRTDRGRVYLQYGAPDYIRDEKNFVGAFHINEQGHIYYLPYQLWRYNKLDKDDANRVFLFWDEMRSGYYKLLVSNARGETWDPLWERRLSQQQLEEYVVGEVGEQFERGY